MKTRSQNREKAEEEEVSLTLPALSNSALSGLMKTPS